MKKNIYFLVKRTFDIFASAFALLVLSPVFLAAIIGIIISDFGPVFYTAERVGKDNVLFKMYKFRSMRIDKNANEKSLRADENRIFVWGSFMRKTKIDELPQLLNVLKGDMTLVGPRPPLPREVEQYSRYAEMRLSVTPGLTCIWQTQPRRDQISFDKWLDMDIAYIGTRSIWQDIKLLFKTVLAVLHLSGS